MSSSVPRATPAVGCSGPIGGPVFEAVAPIGCLLTPVEPRQDALDGAGVDRPRMPAAAPILGVGFDRSSRTIVPIMRGGVVAEDAHDLAGKSRCPPPWNR